MPECIHIGIDLGGTKTEIIALDTDGNTRLRERQPTPAGYAAIIDNIATMVAAAETRLGRAATVGVGTPGAPSRASGRMKNSNSTVLNGRPLAEDLARALARPIQLANDADCFTLSEAVDGAGTGAATVFGVIIGTGCGGGIAIEGTLLSGPNAIAGEWGHNPLPWLQEADHPLPACYCGQYGCLETYVSGPGMSADHARRGNAALNAADIAAAAARGDPAAQQTLERYADRLARGLAGVINILDPWVIVLGGGMSNIEALYRLVPQRWGAYVFSDRVDTVLRPARHGDSSGVRGAAWLGAGGRIGG